MRLELKGVGEFMEQYATGLKQHLGGVVVDERVLDMACAVEHGHVAVATAFGRDAVHILQSVVKPLHGHNAVFRRKIECGKHIMRLIGDIRFRFGDYAVIYLRSPRFR